MSGLDLATQLEHMTRQRDAYRDALLTVSKERDERVRYWQDKFLEVSAQVAELLKWRPPCE